MRILLIDDDIQLAEKIRHRLQAEGIPVDCAFDGDDGLFKAQEGSYDAIILGVLLPRKSGYEVCGRLREANIWTPILMLTILYSETEEAQAFNIGADDFVSKPFSYTVLTARLRALIRRGGKSRPAVLCLGDLHLDPAQRTCNRAGRGIKLTETEFALLELLMQRPSEVLSKREILEHVWGFDFEGAFNLVEVYIGYLRRKIDKPFGYHTIHTVRGAGYQLRTAAQHPL